MRNGKNWALIALLISGLCACGGSGSSSGGSRADETLRAIEVKVLGQTATQREGAPPPPSSDSDAPRATPLKDVVIGFAGSTVVLQLDVEASLPLLAFYLKVFGSDFYFEVLDSSAEQSGNGTKSGLTQKASRSISFELELPSDFGRDDLNLQLSVADTQGRVSNRANVRVTVQPPDSRGGETDPRLVELLGSWFLCTPNNSAGSTVEELNFDGAAVTVTQTDFGSNNCSGTEGGSSTEFRELLLGDDIVDTRGEAAIEADFVAGQPNSRKQLLSFNPHFTILRVLDTELRFGEPSAERNGSSPERRPQTLSDDLVFRRSIAASVPNEAPRAQPGSAQIVEEGSNVTLDGRGSSDSDGQIESYEWRQVGGTAVNLAGANTAQASFVAPEVDADVVLTFALRVTDDDGASNEAPTTVRVRDVAAQNLPPVANAGLDQTVEGGTEVQLNGAQSSDPDGSITSYFWEQTDGPAVTLSDPSQALVQFTAPEAPDQDIVLSFELTVADDQGATSADTVFVTITMPLTDPPVGVIDTSSEPTDVAVISGILVAEAATDLIFVGTDSGLELHDITDPAAPSLLASLELGGVVGKLNVNEFTAIEATGNVRVYVPVEDFGFYTVELDLSEATPALVVAAEHAAPFGGVAVDIFADYYYVVGGEPEIYVINIPTSAGVGSVDTAGPATDLRALASPEPSLAVATGENGVEFFSLAVGASPLSLASSAPEGGGSVTALISEYDALANTDLVYYGADGFGFGIVDGFASAIPFPLGELAIQGASTRGLARMNDLIFLSDSVAGLHVIDISDVDTPVLLETIPTPGSAHDVDVIGNFAYVADRGVGVTPIDISRFLAGESEEEAGGS